MPPALLPSPHQNIRLQAFTKLNSASLHGGAAERPSLSRQAPGMPHPHSPACLQPPTPPPHPPSKPKPPPTPPTPPHLTPPPPAPDRVLRHAGHRVEAQLRQADVDVKVVCALVQHRLPRLRRRLPDWQARGRGGQHHVAHVAAGGGGTWQGWQAGGARGQGEASAPARCAGADHVSRAQAGQDLTADSDTTGCRDSKVAEGPTSQAQGRAAYAACTAQSAHSSGVPSVPLAAAA